MKCPRCKTELVAVGVEQGRASGCESCGGLWLDDRARTDLLERKAEVLARRAPGALPEPDDNAYPRCPQCNAVMKKEEMFYAQVDRCPPHGVWFDRGELEFVAREHAAQVARSARTPGQRYADQAQMWGSLIHSVTERVERAAEESHDDDDE
jgi:Zn-finger nucleic acid-binding protein